MIIYGTNSKLLITQQITETCPNCNTNNTMHISVYQKWAHIFWIPTFPIGKAGGSYCESCNQVLKPKNMPADIRLNYDNIKAQSSLPIWTFSGIGVIVLIAIAVFIFNKQKAQKVTQMIPSIQKGDIMHMKLEDNAYTLVKVNRVKGDSVFLFLNKFQTNNLSGIDDLKSKGYDTLEEGFTIADLKAMDSREEIIDIERNKK
jgi:hypothetical protein